jgi:hypothetical protein
MRSVQWHGRITSTCKALAKPVAQLRQRGIKHSCAAANSKHGHVLLTHFIKRIHQPLARWVETKSLDKGGRPVDVARSYLIYQLAEAAPGIIGEPATVATTGKFVDLCVTRSWWHVACRKRASKRLLLMW